MRVILIGPGSSGKDFLKEYLMQKGYVPSVYCTTRPQREGEINDRDYHFISSVEFEILIDTKKFREWKVFGDKNWHYGITIFDFNGANLFIMTPAGIKNLSDEERRESIIVYLNVPLEVRKERLMKRTGDSAERRLKTDAEDFKNFTDYDLLIEDPFFKPEEILENINNYVRTRENIREKTQN